MSKQLKLFHGMKIISDTEIVKDKYVVEVNSADKLICQYYDDNGDNTDSYSSFSELLLDPSYKKESSVTGAIKRVMGMRNLLISESAVERIEARFQQ